MITAGGTFVRPATRLGAPIRGYFRKAGMFARPAPYGRIQARAFRGRLTARPSSLGARLAPRRVPMRADGPIYGMRRF